MKEMYYGIPSQNSMAGSIEYDKLYKTELEALEAAKECLETDESVTVDTIELDLENSYLSITADSYESVEDIDERVFELTENS